MVYALEAPRYIDKALLRSRNDGENRGCNDTRLQGSKQYMEGVGYGN